MPLQIRRGSTAERLTITPLPGELIYDTTTEQIFVGDGTSLGGRITTGISVEDASDAAAALFTSGIHSGLTFVFDDNNNRIDAAITGPLTTNLTGNVIANNLTVLVDAAAAQITGDINARLGANLNVNGFSIVSTENGNISIDPAGTGNIVLQGSLSIDSFGNFTKVGELNFSSTTITSFGNNSAFIDGNVYITRNSYAGAFGNGFTFAQHHETPDAVNLNFLRTRGIGNAQTAVANGDDIIDLNFIGHDGTNRVSVGGITARVSGAVSLGIVPGELVFDTRTTSGILSTKATLTSEGIWQVNTIQGLTDTLSVAGNLSGDVKGSVYADDSARILDGTNGRITTPSVTLAEFLKLPVYADDTARDSAIPSPEKGMVIFIETGTLPAATDQMQVHNGTSWVNV
jgi:hypothetical protein